MYLKNGAYKAAADSLSMNASVNSKKEDQFCINFLQKDRGPWGSWIANTT